MDLDFELVQSDRAFNYSFHHVYKCRVRSHNSSCSLLKRPKPYAGPSTGSQIEVVSNCLQPQ